VPVDIYVGGMEHAIMHLLYARFIHKFLCDLNDIKAIDKQFEPLREPFKELIVQGLVKGKTYKLKSNGKYLSPSEIKNYTAD
jgi:leucyl-tRNA synthetase